MNYRIFFKGNNMILQNSEREQNTKPLKINFSGASSLGNQL